MPERIYFEDQIARNKRNSVFLMLIVAVVIVALGYVISLAVNREYAYGIIILATIFSIIYVLISYYNSDKIALASVGARKADEREYRDYYNLVEGLTIASGMPMPEIYIMPSQQINAFASGRNPEHSVICVTEGALDKLDRRELEGVLAHELSHVANYDIRYMSLVAVMVGMISIISQIFLRSFQFQDSRSERDKGGIFVIIGLVLAILAPIVVYFVQLGISRKREYSADASAVKFTRNPKGLIGALQKIKEENEPEKRVNKAVAPLFFANPFEDLGSTHPSLQRRIDLLERM
jgi:heat shock protein HtpX